jgi:hypothetical protein
MADSFLDAFHGKVRRSVAREFVEAALEQAQVKTTSTHASRRTGKGLFHRRLRP